MRIHTKNFTFEFLLTFFQYIIYSWRRKWWFHRGVGHRGLLRFNVYNVSSVDFHVLQGCCWIRTGCHLSYGSLEVKCSWPMTIVSSKILTNLKLWFLLERVAHVVQVSSSCCPASMTTLRSICEQFRLMFHHRKSSQKTRLPFLLTPLSIIVSVIHWRLSFRWQTIAIRRDYWLQQRFETCWALGTYPNYWPSVRRSHIRCKRP